MAAATSRDLPTQDKDLVHVVWLGTPLQRVTDHIYLPAGRTVDECVSVVPSPSDVDPRNLTVVIDGVSFDGDRSEHIVGGGALVRVYHRPGDLFSFALIVLSIASAVQAALPIIYVGLALASVIVSALTKPPSRGGPKDSRSTPAHKIGPARNQVSPYSAIPSVYGKRRMHPPYGALPYTQILGDKMHINMVFIPGYGPLQMTDFRIGDTPLSEFGSDVEIEVRDGEDTDLPLTLFSSTVIEQDLNWKLYDSQKKQPTGDFTAETALNTDRATVIMSFPGGLFHVTNTGSTKHPEHRFRIEHRLAGSSDPWLVLPADTEVSSKAGVTVLLTIPKPVAAGLGTVQSRGKSGFFVSWTWDLPTKDQYEVRVIWDKSSISTGDSQVSIESRWIRLASVLNEDPVAGMAPHIARIALRVRATDNLNGSIDSFNFLAERKLPIWNGSSWSTPTLTRNPAWVLVDLLKGNAQPRPITDTFMDRQSFLDLADVCDAKGWEFNAVMEGKKRTFDVFRDVASACRASLTQIDGKVGVFVDIDRSAEPVTDVFNPTEATRDSFSGDRVFPRVPHALRVRFDNEDIDYTEDEVVVYTSPFDAGSATEFDELDLIGVTNQDDAVRFARYFRNQMTFRSKRFVQRVDVGQSVFHTRGDLVAFAHDAALIGVGHGRINALSLDGGSNILGFTTPELIEIDGDKVYGTYVRRIVDMTVVQLDLVNPVAPATIEEHDTFVFVTPQSPASIEIGDIVTVGERTIEIVRCIVDKIIPGSDLTATIHMIEEAPGLHSDADDVSIPAHDPGISLPRSLVPGKPSVLGIANQSFGQITVTLSPAQASPAPSEYFEVQLRVAPVGAWQRYPPVPVLAATPFLINALANGTVYELRARASAGSLPGAWADIVSFTYEDPAVTTPLLSITGLAIKGRGSSNIFVGAEAAFEWRLNAEGVDAISNPAAVEQAVALVDTYEVRVTDADTGTVLRVDAIGNRTEYTYTRQMSIEDGGPYRHLVVGVRVRDKFARWSGSKSTEANNDSPATINLISVQLSGQTGVFRLRIPRLDPDFRGVIAWSSTTQGFTPSSANLIYKGAVDEFMILRLDVGDHYIVYAGYDDFTDDPALLNLSAEMGPYSFEISSDPQLIIDSAIIRNANIESLSATKIVGGVLDVDVIGANTLRAEKVAIGSLDNVIWDPVFESSDWASNMLLDLAGGTGSWSSEITNQLNGPRCAKFTYGGDETGNPSLTFNGTSNAFSGPHVKTGPGDLWYFEVKTRVISLFTTDRTRCEMEFFDKDNNTVGTIQGSLGGNSTSYERIFVQAVAPTDAFYVVFRVTIADGEVVGLAALIDTAYARRMIEPNIVDGGIIVSVDQVASTATESLDDDDTDGGEVFLSLDVTAGANAYLVTWGVIIAGRAHDFAPTTAIANFYWEDAFQSGHSQKGDVLGPGPIPQTYSNLGFSWTSRLVASSGTAEIRAWRFTAGTAQIYDRWIFAIGMKE